MWRAHKVARANDFSRLSAVFCPFGASLRRARNLGGLVHEPARAIGSGVSIL
jgi:hypothetical protein